MARLASGSEPLPRVLALPKCSHILGLLFRNFELRKAGDVTEHNSNVETSLLWSSPSCFFLQMLKNFKKSINMGRKYY